MPKDLRLTYVKRGKPLTFTLHTDDQQAEIQAFEGETIATALLASGSPTLRHTLKQGAPRSLFCAVGSCYDCVMEVNGESFVRACSTLVEDGMIVKVTQQ